MRELTSFVGRRTDLVALAALFESGRSLVTVVGPPGIGKTRLVRRLLGTMDHEARVVFCDLRGVDRAEDLAAVVAEGLDVRLDDGHDLGSHVEAVGSLLAGRGTLVVLDNFEQLAAEASRTVHHWLRAAPDAAFLVTSRRLLRIEGEVAHELSPLARSLAEGERLSEAAQLFVDRAREAEPRFVGEDAVLPSVEALVERLEGVPLAIELAASQMRLRRPRDLLRLLQRKPTIALQSCLADVDPCHASLRSAIDASWRMLEAAERDALGQLTVFRQGFDLEAAEAVLDLSLHPEVPTVDAVIAALREASLLRVEIDDTAAPMRWSLYEGVREFASEQANGSAVSRHAQHFLARGERWANELATSHSVEARAAIARDLSNLRAAFEWFAGQGASMADACARLALALYEVHRISRPALALEPLTIAIEAAGQSPRRLLRGWLLLARGVCHRSIGQRVKAKADFDVVACLAPPDSELFGNLDLEVGIYHFHLGELAEARRHYEAAAEVARRLEQLHLEARAEMRLGWLLCDGCQDARSFDHYDRAIRLFREIGDVREEAVARSLRAVHRIFHQRGDPTAELDAQVEVAQRLRDPELEAMSEEHLGLCSADVGDLEKARAHFERARTIALSCGHRRLAAINDLNVGAVLEESGDTKAAGDHYARAHEVFRATGEGRFVSLVLSRLSVLWAKGDRVAKGLDGLAESHAMAKQFDDGGFQLVADIQRARVAVVESQRAIARGEADEAEKHRTDAVAWVQAAKGVAASGAHYPNGNRTILSCSPDARWALRLFHRELESKPSEGTSLRLWSDGGAFQLGERPVVALPNGPTIRAVVRALGEERARAPGRSISVEAFMKRCWADETLSPLVGSQRVRNIVARLRKAGLADVLRRDESGYLLVPEARFAWVDAAGPAHMSS